MNRTMKKAGRCLARTATYVAGVILGVTLGGLAGIGLALVWPEPHRPSDVDFYLLAPLYCPLFGAVLGLIGALYLVDYLLTPAYRRRSW